METIPANVLARSDRVVIHSDELPYLVDSVVDMMGGVRVTYSSGDVVEYTHADEVTVIDN